MCNGRTEINRQLALLHSQLFVIDFHAQSFVPKLAGLLNRVCPKANGIQLNAQFHISGKRRYTGTSSRYFSGVCLLQNQ